MGSEFQHFPQQPGGSFPISTTPDGRLLVQSRNVLQYTRTFFGCAAAAGAEFERTGSGIGRIGSHWEDRTFDVRTHLQFPARPIILHMLNMNGYRLRL